MTLTARIVALVLAVQLALTGAAAVALALGARASVAAEVAASSHSTRSLVLAALATLSDTVPGERLPAALAERLVEPRHARITVYEGLSGRSLSPGTATPRPDLPPRWFVRLLSPPGQATELPIVQDRLRYGMVMIAPDPTVGLAALWRDARTLALLTAAAALAQVLATAMILRAGLAPLARLREVVNRLGRGELSARAGAVTTPDLAPLAADVDRLGAALVLRQQHKLIANCGVRYIGGSVAVRRQRLKFGAPFFWHSVRFVQVELINLFHVGSVTS